MRLIAYLSFVFLFLSCENKTNQQDKETEKKELAPEVKASDFDALMQKIDLSLPDLVRVESLIYFKEDGSTMSATAYFDQNELITKIEEEFLDGKTGVQTISNFYSNGGVLFASEKTTIKGTGETAYFSDEISFYTPEGKVTESKERTSALEEHIDREVFRKINPTIHSSENAYKVLRQQGPYATTFQGFVENGPYHFLIVGENVQNDGYTASLSIQEDNPTLRWLREKGKNALGQELEVLFERHTDGMGYVVSILNKVTLIERKK